MNQVSNALSKFIDQAVEIQPEGHFTSEFDADWRSMCEFETTSKQSLWRPTAQAGFLDFSGLSNAAEQPIHPDIQSYFSSFWSGSLLAKSSEGPVDLIQLWNTQDFDRLIENLVGHLFVQQRAKLPFTIFFATTDVDSELFLSIDNSSGKILLEEPGRAPIREVETNMATFLNRLEPMIREFSE